MTGRVVLDILFNVLGPILLLIFLGAVLRRKFALDVGTLSKLNLYLFTPAFMFHQVSTSTLAWGAMGGIVIVTVLQVLALGLLVWGIGKALGAGDKTLAAVALAVMFYNSGTYGLPLAALAFPKEPAADPGAAGGLRDGAAVQTFVAFTQNLLTYTVGLAIAAWAGTGKVSDGLTKLLRMPVLPTITAALLARWYLTGGEGRALPAVVERTAGYLSDGLVPVALVTLGAQLASNTRWPRWRPVVMVLALRLVAAPALMAGLLFGLHQLGWGPLRLWPWPAASLVLTAAVPTAVVTLLLTIEVGGDAELAADCVFWTTVFSCVTITAWLVAIRLWFG